MRNEKSVPLRWAECVAEAEGGGEAAVEVEAEAVGIVVVDEVR